MTLLELIHDIKKRTGCSTMKKEVKIIIYFIGVGASAVIALVTFANAEYLRKDTFAEFKYGMEKSIYQELRDINQELKKINKALPNP